MIKEVTVPDIGNYSQVEIIEVSVKQGDIVAKEDTLITLETEKASMDIPSPFAGVIQSLRIKKGDKVSKGDLILVLEVQDTSVQKAPAEEKAKPAAAEVVEPMPKASVPEVNNAQTTSTTPQKVEVCVPDIGNYDQVEIIEVSVQKGSQVEKEDSLITLETEKASMDIPSPHSGVILDLKVKKGDRVSKGDLILVLEAKIAQPVAATPKQISRPQTVSSEIANEPKQKPPATTPTAQLGFVYAGPASRRLARELGVDLSQVKGSGHKGRIVTQDIQAYVKAKLQSLASGTLGIEKAPEIDFTQFGEIEVKPMGRIKKWTAKNLYRNWVTIPHVTQFDEADITELENFREENKQAAADNGIKLTPLVFIMKACVSALKQYPQFNASLSSNGEDLIYKKYFHIGFAVDTPNGLVVPVVRHVDNKGLFDLAREISLLSNKAREGKLKSEEMQGSCFTISSLGSVGGTAFTPIINAPDLAILGVSKASIKPMYSNETWIPRKMLPLSLSYDHRVIDGVEAAKFTVHLVAQLQDIRKLLL